MFWSHRSWAPALSPETPRVRLIRASIQTKLMLARSMARSVYGLSQGQDLVVYSGWFVAKTGGEIQERARAYDSTHGWVDSRVLAGFYLTYGPQLRLNNFATYGSIFGAVGFALAPAARTGPLLGRALGVSALGVPGGVAAHLVPAAC
jgi:hypothetical protein